MFDEKIEVMENISANNTGDLECVLRFDPPVYCQRYSAVQEILVNAKWRGKIKKVVDFGCSEFGLFPYVKKVIGLQEILFVDVDVATLESYITRLYPLNADYLRRRREPLNITVLNGSIANPSIEVMNIDAVLCIEIIEHLYPDTLDAMPYNIFGVIKPRIAIFTTPNADFNVLFPNFSGFRHWDHKFEWSREEFQDWANNVISRYPDYTVYFQGVGSGPTGTEKYGECSQMAVFLKTDVSLRNSLELEYKNFFVNNIIDENNDNSMNVDNCKFCEYEQNYYYDFISYGVCSYLTYTSCNNETDRNNHCIHSNLFYKEIGEIEYPVDIDNRTQEERILHDVQYKIFKLGSYNSLYYNDVLDQGEIPLYELTYTTFDEMISNEDLRTILQNAGYEIRECDIRGQIIPCVLYNPNETMSRGSNRTKSSENQEQKDFVPQSDEENWDEQVPTNFTSELSSDSLPPQITENLTETKTETGESSTSPPTKLECLYNSGCPASSSSIEMVTPELIRSMQLGKLERKSDAIKAKSEQENVKLQKNQLKRQTMNNPILRLTVMKSDGNIKLQKCPINEENMANSSNELEQTNDEILNNTNENISLAENINTNLTENMEENDTNLENVSQEALYDVNSENNLSDLDSTSAEQALYNPIRTGLLPIQVISSDDSSDPSAFPAWLLHLLHVSEVDTDSVLDSEPHFYSQGDGLGIHPSLSELSTDSSNSDVTAVLPDIVPQRIPNLFLERIDAASGLSENDNSEDYFSVDEDNYVGILNNALESNSQYVVRELPLDLNITYFPLLETEDRTENTEDNSTLPEQSTSNKKD